MDSFAELADRLMSELDKHPHAPPDNVSATLRGEAAVLRLLGTSGEAMSAGSISQRLGMRTSRIAAVLNSLEKKGLIARRSDAQDKRRVMVHLTDDGMAQHMKHHQGARAHTIALLTALGEEDAEAFVRVISRMLDILPTLECSDSDTKEAGL